MHLRNTQEIEFAAAIKTIRNLKDKLMSVMIDRDEIRGSTPKDRKRSRHTGYFDPARLQIGESGADRAEGLPRSGVNEESNARRNRCCQTLDWSFVRYPGQSIVSQELLAGKINRLLLSNQHWHAGRDVQHQTLPSLLGTSTAWQPGFWDSCWKFNLLRLGIVFGRPQPIAQLEGSKFPRLALEKATLAKREKGHDHSFAS
jgi:hypothetical protein